MARFKIVAPDGVRLKVTIQKSETRPEIITREGWDADGNRTMLKEYGPPQTVWTDHEIVTFASEEREFITGEGTCVVVEEQ